MATSQPVVYMLFDLLFLDGHSLLEQTYENRRRLLAKLELTGPAWQTPAYHEGNGAGAAGGVEGPGPGGRRGQAARLPVRPRAALAAAG